MHRSVSLATYTKLKLQCVYGLISLAGQSPNEDEDVMQAEMTNVKFGRICRQQYVIVFNDGRCDR